jgi:signal transduction histidine kinase
MGLSLAVSLALLRSIGGDLRIESEPGRGTTATVVLEAPRPAGRA